MANVERNAIPTPPNQTLGSAVNSSGPQGRSASTVHAPNAMVHDGNANNGFLPMTKQASTVQGSNESFRFNVQDAKMPQPPSVLQPGPGAIPVNPFMGANGTTSSLRIPDKAGKTPPR